MVVRYAGVLWVLMSLTSGLNVASPGEAIRYQLTGDSWFGEICELCECPDSMQILRGSFSLVPTEESDGFRNFEVREVQWWTGYGSEPVRITGSGAYRLEGASGRRQLLELDLRSGERQMHLTSGLVEAEVEFPHLLVRLEGDLKPTCRDTVVLIGATPDSRD
jgi:hypothetical protein